MTERGEKVRCEKCQGKKKKEKSEIGEIVQSRDRRWEGEGVLNFGIVMNWLQWSLHTLKRKEKK